MKNSTIALYVLGAIVILGAGYFAYSNKASSQDVATTKTADHGKPTFTWKYAPTSRDDIPETVVSLEAKYADGTTTTKPVEKVEGSCNEYQPRDADVYPQSQTIMCYYAGFGRYYKVVEENGTYTVKRREFEEASPDYTPPVAKFETMVQF